VVRPDVARLKIARAAARLEQAEALVGRPLEEFLADPQALDLASFYLLLAIQEVIDLAAHWVADAGWSPPEEAGATFDLMADRGAIERDLARRLRGAVGLRNRIAHGYADLDNARVHTEFREGVDALRKFLGIAAASAGL
jgi:uncharacterized protein YutE (UPF0331/DUF86 family)